MAHKRLMSLLVVHWYFVLLSVTMHNQHFKKHKDKVKRNSKELKIKNMEVCKVMAHDFQEEEYDGKK